MPYVQLLADFREEIRKIAREEKGLNRNFALLVSIIIIIRPCSK